MEIAMNSDALTKPTEMDAAAARTLLQALKPL
jgi:hypothetical protein